MTDDIFDFDKTPEDKFFQLLCTMNKNVVQNELTGVFKRLVILEEMLDDEELDKKVKSFEFSDPEKMEQLMQNFYLHVTANMIGQHE